MQNHVLDYLTEMVKRKPDKLAFAGEAGGLTFKEVYGLSRRLASCLAKKGIYHRPVVVFMNKSPEEVTAFFGVITAGNFYVPIDEEMPGGRIQLILDNVKAPVIICDEGTKAAADAFRFEGEIMLYSDVCKTEAEEGRLAEIYERAIDTDPLYIVFTSGSTGIPKGVAACHRSVIDYVEQLSETLGFNEDTIFGNQAPLYVDACLKELYPTLKFGATTYLIPKRLFMLPVKLVEFMNEKRINTVCWVVSALTMISAFGALKTVKPAYLHTVAFGSEVFPVKQFNLWKEALPHAKFINLYGPTEGTGMCCYYRADREFRPGEVIPIGRPFKNTEILLLTEDNREAGPGETGEICIRGASLTLGYYHDPGTTKEVFVQNPLNTAYPELIYRTGDLGKYNQEGELMFVSRRDDQIKHMGHRIELGEIEVSANMLEGIKLAGCVYDEVKGKIVLYYVGNLTDKEVAVLLKGKLPRYMMPNRIISLAEMPLTANGKIDRVTLKAYYQP